MSLTVQKYSLQPLRDLLLSDTRGLKGAFKLALGEAVHFWRNNFAKRHFEEESYQRYGSPQAKYTSMRPVDPSGFVNGTQDRKWEAIFMMRTGLTMASAKMRSQFWRHKQMNNRPLVFTGRTRTAILQGPFKVRGTSDRVRGSWSGDVNWYGLTRIPGMGSPARTNLIGRAYPKLAAQSKAAYIAARASGGTFGQGLVAVSADEIQVLSDRIKNVYFPVYRDMAQAHTALPKLEDLPLLN